ncbi:MAG: hypothetical protein FJX92_01600 [Bacteroidetes bacterium]|nr:hypothetical protein [Bacteroidota bacterium]
MNTLKTLLQEVNSIGFWGRLFGWRRIKQLLVEAHTELRLLLDNRDQHQHDLGVCRHELTQMEMLFKSSERRITDLARDKDVLVVQMNELRDRLRERDKEIVDLKHAIETKSTQQIQSIQMLDAFRNEVIEERRREQETKQAQALEKQERQRETWQRHQADTAERLKSICQKHTIEYIDKVPFKGDPDNTIRICGEYIVFDAKSPAGEDLSNFPTYLKGQAEKAIKYSKQEGVKKDIYFVVPSNTLEELEKFMYPHADHDVYIIAADALEPVLLSLQKIEEYEFAEELTPDQRANVCRVIGCFAHLAKRRIQIDHFFATQTIELAYACENYLPADILEQVKEYERSEKLNPPMEKRIKSIPVGEIEKDTQKVQREAEGRGVFIDPDQVSANMNELPLYRP